MTSHAMKGGGHYNQHSTPQRMVVSMSLPFIKAGVAAAQYAHSGGSGGGITIADFGCSEGANSFLAMKCFIESIRSRHSVSTPVTVVHNDLPTNDWNVLMQSLTTSADSYLLTPLPSQPPQPPPQQSSQPPAPAKPQPLLSLSDTKQQTGSNTVGLSIPSANSSTTATQSVVTGAVELTHESSDDDEDEPSPTTSTTAAPTTTTTTITTVVAPVPVAPTQATVVAVTTTTAEAINKPVFNLSHPNHPSPAPSPPPGASGPLVLSSTGSGSPIIASDMPLSERLRLYKQLRRSDPAAKERRKQSADQQTKALTAQIQMLTTENEQLRTRLMIATGRAGAGRGAEEAKKPVLSLSTPAAPTDTKPGLITPLCCGLSFYQPILPPGTVHFAYAATTTHWLSRRPLALTAGLQCHMHSAAIAAGSSGNSGVDLVRAATEDRAFEEQARTDWRVFLHARSVELAPGGVFVLVSPISTDRSVGPSNTGGGGGVRWFSNFPVMRIMYDSVLSLMVDRKEITAQERTDCATTLIYRYADEYLGDPKETGADSLTRWITTTCQLEVVSSQVMDAPNPIYTAYAGGKEKSAATGTATGTDTGSVGTGSGHGDRARCASDFVSYVRGWFDGAVRRSFTTHTQANCSIPNPTTEQIAAVIEAKLTKFWAYTHAQIARLEPEEYLFPRRHLFAVFRKKFA